MWRILFLVLWIIPVFQPFSYGAIEIFADGHKYDSLQAYRASEKVKVLQTASIPATLNDQQEDYVRQRAKELGIDVDISKIKTVQVVPKKIADATMHQLYVLSVESGVVGALQDFYQNWGESDYQMTHRITSQQLQKAIEEAVTKSNDPKLLISQPGKMRIMDLNSDNGSK